MKLAMFDRHKFCNEVTIIAAKLITLVLYSMLHR